MFEYVLEVIKKAIRDNVTRVEIVIKKKLLKRTYQSLNVE